jgi:hypothetical protein
MLPSAETNRDSQAMSSSCNEQSAANELGDSSTCTTSPMRAAHLEYDARFARTVDASDNG